MKDRRVNTLAIELSPQEERRLALYELQMERASIRFQMTQVNHLTQKYQDLLQTLRENTAKIASL